MAFFVAWPPFIYLSVLLIMLLVNPTPSPLAVVALLCLSAISIFLAIKVWRVPKNPVPRPMFHKGMSFQERLEAARPWKTAENQRVGAATPAFLTSVAILLGSAALLAVVASHGRSG